jgi:imidazolonepropionase
LVFAAAREKEFEDRINGLSYEEIASRGGGILNSAKKLREMSEDDLFELSKERLREVIKMGTGAIEIKSGYGLSIESELKMLRVIRRLKELNWIPVTSTLLAAHALPEEYKDSKKDYLQLIGNKLIPEVAKQKLADSIDIFCEKGYFDTIDTQYILSKGNEVGLKGKIHVNQFNVIGGVKTGVENNALSVDHLELVSDEDIEQLQQSSTIATLLPSCSFFLSIPYAPARRLIEANLPIALASDYNPGSTPSGNMNFVVSLACIKQKLTPQEAFNAATFNGACAMEMQKEVGSISRGKRANLMVTGQVSSLAYLPYSFGQHQLDRVIINGEKF